MPAQLNHEPDSGSKKKPNTLTGVIMFLLLAAAIIIMAFAVYLKSIGYDFKDFSIERALDYARSNSRTSTGPDAADISFSQDGSVDFKVYRENIILLSQDGVKWYDKKGKLLQEVSLTMTRPVIRISKKYMAVVDISGRDIYMFKEKTQLWTRKLDNQIINAEVSEDGNCTVVTQSREFKSAVLVIDANGADKYTKLCAEDMVLGTKTLNDGENIIINKVNTKGIKAGTQFEFNNFYEEKPYAAIDIADNVFPVLQSVGGNTAAIGQNIILFMDKQGKELWRKNAQSVFCTAPGSSKYVIVAGKFNDTSGASSQRVLVLNQKGEEVYSFEQPENISGMSAYGDRLALRTQRSIYLYTIKGQKLGHYIAKNEIKDAYLTGANEAVVITGGNISLVEIK
ncbi:hypothetical protein CLHUN_13500 [Ruminiclostridium hungatei]|uniref:Outer membrane protein assembly factor BamB n=1 Tax=Ruminiclostridium hungatei TaxID=48256 RepID=A0A1V4SMT8_RUMHU|nr:hypothetical protein CLHUN_13500 [Ruminiclostridium hungatei]